MEKLKWGWKRSAYSFPSDPLGELKWEQLVVKAPYFSGMVGQAVEEGLVYRVPFL